MLPSLLAMYLPHIRPFLQPHPQFGELGAKNPREIALQSDNLPNSAQSSCILKPAAAPAADCSHFSCKSAGNRDTAVHCMDHFHIIIAPREHLHFALCFYWKNWYGDELFFWFDAKLLPATKWNFTSKLQINEKRPSIIIIFTSLCSCKITSGDLHT